MDAAKRIRTVCRWWMGVLVAVSGALGGQGLAAEPPADAGAAVGSGLRHHLSVYVGSVSIKEGFNGGMVFNGPQAAVRYELHWSAGVFDFAYSPELALGVPLSRGMAAVNLQITPVELAFQAPVWQTGRHRLQLGGEVAARYRYQTYPDLQNAHLFWFGEIGLSLRLGYAFHWQGGRLSLQWANSLLGFVSHTPDNPSYFYSLRLADFVVRPHQNLQFGSFDRYDRTVVRLEYAPAALPPHAFGLGLEYVGYYGAVRYQTLNCYLLWRKVF